MGSVHKTPEEFENKAFKSLVFICRQNQRRSEGILLFPYRPRFCRLMKTRNRRYPRSSGLKRDKSGESGAFLFSRRVPDFCNGGRSFRTNENSNLYRWGRRRRLFPFRKQTTPFVTVDAMIGNQAFHNW